RRCGLFFVFDLSCFAGLVCGFGLVLTLAIKDLRGRRHHHRTTSTPPTSVTRGVRSQEAAMAPPASTATLRSQQKSSPILSNLVARLVASFANIRPQHRGLMQSIAQAGPCIMSSRCGVRI